MLTLGKGQAQDRILAPAAIAVAALFAAALAAAALRTWAVSSIEQMLRVQTAQASHISGVQVWLFANVLGLITMGLVCLVASYVLTSRLGSSWAGVAVSLVAVALWVLVVLITGANTSAGVESLLSPAEAAVRRTSLTAYPYSYFRTLRQIAMLLRPGLGWQVMPIAFAFFVLPAGWGASAATRLADGRSWR